MVVKKKAGAKTAAKFILTNSVKPKKEESLVILTDEKRKEIALAIFEKASAECSPVLFLIKENMPEIAMQIVQNADIIILMGNRSLEISPNLLKARKEGARIVSLCELEENSFDEITNSDYGKIRHLTDILAKTLEGAKQVMVTSEEGTNLQFKVGHQPVIRMDGMGGKIKEMINLPDGEVSLAPIEGSAEGVIVVDGSISGSGKIKEKESVELHVRAGRAFIYSKSKKSKELAELIDKYGPNASVVGKFGIGTNSAVSVDGKHSDRKSLGTVHFTLGNNKIFGGTNNCDTQIDLVITKPTVIVDNMKIIKDGKIQYEQIFH